MAKLNKCGIIRMKNKSYMTEQNKSLFLLLGIYPLFLFFLGILFGYFLINELVLFFIYFLTFFLFIVQIASFSYLKFKKLKIVKCILLIITEFIMFYCFLPYAPPIGDKFYKNVIYKHIIQAKKPQNIKLINSASECKFVGGRWDVSYPNKYDRSFKINFKRSCEIPFSDGGKICNDSSQCKSKYCIYDYKHKLDGEFILVGHCLRWGSDHDVFGKFMEIIEEGKVYEVSPVQ